MTEATAPQPTAPIIKVGDKVTGKVNAMKMDGTYHWVDFAGVVSSSRVDERLGEIFYIDLDAPYLERNHWTSHVLHFVNHAYKIQELTVVEPKEG